jgi:BMFP domain-containing protein YqiC
MQTENRILDDLARVASGALSGVTGVKREVESRLKEQFARILAEMEVVSREEYEVARAMAAKARDDQMTMRDRLNRLEAQIAALETRLAAAERQAGAASSAGESGPVTE